MKRLECFYVVPVYFCKAQRMNCPPNHFITTIFGGVYFQVLSIKTCQALIDLATFSHDKTSGECRGLSLAQPTKALPYPYNLTTSLKVHAILGWIDYHVRWQHLLLIVSQSSNTSLAINILFSQTHLHCIQLSNTLPPQSTQSSLRRTPPSRYLDILLSTT